MKNRITARLAAIDSEIALLIASRADASCAEELEMICDSIEAARKARRMIARTR